MDFIEILFLCDGVNEGGKEKCVMCCSQINQTDNRDFFSTSNN